MVKILTDGAWNPEFPWTFLMSLDVQCPQNFTVQGARFTVPYDDSTEQALVVCDIGHIIDVLGTSKASVVVKCSADATWGVAVTGGSKVKYQPLASGCQRECLFFMLQIFLKTNLNLIYTLYNKIYSTFLIFFFQN